MARRATPTTVPPLLILRLRLHELSDYGNSYQACEGYLLDAFVPAEILDYAIGMDYQLWLCGLIMPRHDFSVGTRFDFTPVLKDMCSLRSHRAGSRIEGVLKWSWMQSFPLDGVTMRATPREMSCPIPSCSLAAIRIISRDYDVYDTV